MPGSRAKHGRRAKRRRHVRNRHQQRGLTSTRAHVLEQRQQAGDGGGGGGARLGGLAGGQLQQVILAERLARHRVAPRLLQAAREAGREVGGGR